MSSGVRGRVRAADLLVELVRTIAARPGRTLAAGVSVVLASAAYVATTGLSATLAQQVTDRFDAARATEVDASYRSLSDRHPTQCPAEPVDSVSRLAAVVAVGQLDTVKSTIVASGADPARTVDGALVGATAGTLDAIRPRLVAGRRFDDGQNKRGDPVALVPLSLAQLIGVTAPGQSIRIADHRLLVLGTFDDVQRRPDMLRAVIVPASTMARLPTGPPDDDQHTCGVIVATRAGAAAQVAGQLPFALRPDAPNSLVVIGPPDPATFRRSVARPVRLLALALSIAALAMGASSIASTMSASVAARVGEIGLRKALGARSMDIAAQITGESLLVGLTASLVGASAGCYGVIGVALAHHGQPILSLPAVAVACAAGAAVGAVAGLVPAIRAARMPASEALRR